jgi:hypothetical protein
MKHLSEPPGTVYLDGVGYVRLSTLILKRYYSGVNIPATVDQEMEIPLFGQEHIGDSEWTNLETPNHIAKGHSALIYRVALSVKAAPDTTLMDIYTALQFGDLFLRLGANRFQEPLSAYPVTLYGEVVERQDDPTAALQKTKRLLTDLDDQEEIAVIKRLMSALIPTAMDFETWIEGTVTLRPGLTIGSGFVLYVCLYSITSLPLR